MALHLGMLTTKPAAALPPFVFFNAHLTAIAKVAATLIVVGAMAIKVVHWVY